MVKHQSEKLFKKLPKPFTRKNLPTFDLLNVLIKLTSEVLIMFGECYPW